MTERSADNASPPDSSDEIRVADAARRLVEAEILAITGPPGAGASALARRVAAATGRPVLEARLWGCQGEGDILRALGEALGLPVCADFSAIAAAVSRDRELVLLLDEADVPELMQVLDSLGGAGARACALLTGRSAPEGVACVGLEAGPPPPPPEHPLAAVLAQLPAGLPGEHPGSPLRGRIALPRGACEALSARLSPARAAELAAAEVPELLAVSQGAPWPPVSPFADALLLRFLAQNDPDPDRAAAAAGAGARLLAAAGQLTAARELLTAARELLTATRERPVSAAGESLLQWAEGDVLLAYGLLVDATDHHRAALRLAPSSPAVLNASAGLLAERGLVNEARRRFKEARAIALRVGDPVRAAEALRGLAEVAVSAGEALSADALYEEAAIGLADSPIGQANLAVGQATLAIARGDTTSAERHLEEAERLAGAVPLIQASLLRRRAELRLRQGRHPEAQRLVGRALELLLRLGHRAAAANALRLSGDVAAAAREPREAVERYEQALHASARVGDLVGARRTLAHLLEVERIGGDGARVEELLHLIAEIDTELGDPERDDGMRL